MIINNLKELEEYGTLRQAVYVYFPVGEETIKYQVRENYLNTITINSGDEVFNNDIIFELLNIDRFELAKKVYGYDVEAVGIYWPCSKRDDYPALTRLVKEIYKIIEPEVVYTSIKNRWELLDIR